MTLLTPPPPWDRATEMTLVTRELTLTFGRLVTFDLWSPVDLKRWCVIVVLWVFRRVVSASGPGHLAHTASIVAARRKEMETKNTDTRWKRRNKARNTPALLQGEHHHPFCSNERKNRAPVWKQKGNFAPWALARSLMNYCLSFFMHTVLVGAG